MVTDWNMTIRKIVVYGGLFLLFMFAMLILAFMGVSGYLIALLAGLFLFVQYFFSDRLVLWSTGAHIVDASEAPRLHMTIEKLCSAMGLPKPRIAIINNDMPNAFATGRSRKKAVVTVTTGILKTLNDKELEAVLAHELTHVKNSDMFVVTFASFVVSVLSFIIYMIIASFLSRDENNFMASIAAWMISMVLSNTIGVIIINTVSRYREYGADRGSALTTRDPDSLISALRKITDSSNYSKADVRGLESAKALCISSTTKSNFMELFSTHPTVEKRIAALEKIKSELRGY
jgi:heat shock protein HtpX